MTFTISENIRYYRLQNKMTQLDLAGKVGVDRSVIQRYESGVIAVPYERIISISEALGVSPTKLMGLEEENSESVPAIVEIYNRLSPENQKTIVDLAKMMLTVQQRGEG